MLDYFLNLTPLLQSIFYYCSVYILVNLVIWFLCLYFIFNKAYKKGFYAFIPFLNLYEYMKICHIGWYWGFIPIVNIIVFWTSPYLLGYQFGQKEYLKIISLFCPWFMFLLVAFSKASYIHPKLASLDITSVKDIDRLEEKIINDTLAEEKKEENKIKKTIFEKKKKEKKKNKDEKSIFLDTLDSKYLDIEDEIVDSEENIIPISSEPVLKVEEYPDSFVELDDYNYEHDVDDLKDLNIIEKNVVLQGKEVAIDTSDYKELEGEKQSDEEIAFHQTKKQQLVCPRCGSSLIGAKDICPGCGSSLKELQKGR